MLQGSGTFTKFIYVVHTKYSMKGHSFMLSMFILIFWGMKKNLSISCQACIRCGGDVVATTNQTLCVFKHLDAC
jgi:hypothetical protein